MGLTCLDIRLPHPGLSLSSTYLHPVSGTAVQSTKYRRPYTVYVSTGSQSIDLISSHLISSHLILSLPPHRASHVVMNNKYNGCALPFHFGNPSLPSDQMPLFPFKPIFHPFALLCFASICFNETISRPTSLVSARFVVSAHHAATL